MVDKKTLNKKLNEILSQNKQFKEKKDNEKVKEGDQVTFDYNIKVNDKEIENGKGKGVQIEIGKDLFIKGFDKQLVGTIRNEKKIVKANLPPNYPDKKLINKEAIFECEIKVVKEPKKSELNDEFAKQLGAKNLKDLEEMVEKQIKSQYNQSLEAITKSTILDQLEKSHSLELPESLVNNEIKNITQSLKSEDKSKFEKENEKKAKTRIKLGLLLNEYGEKNNLKVSDTEIQNEINKQIRTIPGQEKFVLEYYKNNPMATQSIKGSIYEEKILNLIKSKMQISKKQLSVEEAESLILTKKESETKNSLISKSNTKNPKKAKKISKK